MPGASEKVGGREGSGQNAWCGQKEPTARTPWETEKKKSSEFTRRDFEDKGCGRTKSLCPVQVPLPKEQGWFCSLCCRIKMKMFGKYFGYI